MLVSTEDVLLILDASSQWQLSISMVQIEMALAEGFSQEEHTNLDSGTLKEACSYFGAPAQRYLQ